MDSHQGQILHGAVCAGPRVHVWQVRGGDQPAVLAAGAGLHHGAGGHGGDAADLAIPVYISSVQIASRVTHS